MVKHIKQSYINTLENQGYIVIRDAITYPALKLRRLKKDNRAHSKTMWNLRFEVKKHYEKLWNTNDLISCFGGNILELDNYTIPWHIDQNSSHEDILKNVQGVLALSESNATQLLVNSHKYFN